MSGLALFAVCFVQAWQPQALRVPTSSCCALSCWLRSPAVERILARRLGVDGWFVQDLLIVLPPVLQRRPAIGLERSDFEWYERAQPSAFRWRRSPRLLLLEILCLSSVGARKLGEGARGGGARAIGGHRPQTRSADNRRLRDRLRPMFPLETGRIRVRRMCCPALRMQYEHKCAWCQ